MISKNIIAFQKGMVLCEDKGASNELLAMTVQAELMKFGYLFDRVAMTALAKASRKEIINLHDEVIEYLKDITGGVRVYKPFYKGFPEEVMQLSEYVLWQNQILHYMSDGNWEPSEWAKPFKTAFESPSYRYIALANEDAFSKIFTSLCSAGNSLTPQDLEVIKWFVKTQTNLIMPESIPFKENLCTLAALGLNVPVKTPTDVLRIAVSLSGGDISLPAVPRKTIRQFTRTRYGGRGVATSAANPEREKFKFRNFKKSERRMLLSLLEKTNCDVREMKLKANRWVRLGEKLHPGDFQTLYPKAYDCFTKIREEKVVSWYGEVTKAFRLGFTEGLKKLTERPGEFLRRLDYLLRKNGPEKRDLIFQNLFEIGMRTSNKVLFEVYTHFEGRNVEKAERSIFIKGARKKIPLPKLEALSNVLVNKVQETILNAIKHKFTSLPPLGDCWVDPELKKIPLPTNMRSLSESLKPIIRGQRTPIGTGKKVIRPFIHWWDETGSIDLDLHGFLMGSSSAVSFGYNGIHANNIGCYSGDVRHRQGACAEYVDIDVEKALEAGFKYFVMVIHNFEDRPLKSIKECVCGVMEREFPEKNPHWLPETILNSFKPQSTATMTLIGCIDLETREYIHLDLDWETFSRYVHGGEADNLFQAIKPFIALPKLSVYDLLSWHVLARGNFVESKELAEKQFMFQDFEGSYTETLQYLGV